MKLSPRLLIGAALAALLLLMQYRLWIAPDSLPDAWAVQRKVDAQRRENGQLRERNRNLGAEVRDLKQGHDAVEARARAELGMIKRGETFYQIIRPRPAPQQPEPRSKPPD